MSGQKDAVTIRRLPDGEAHPARIESAGIQPARYEKVERHQILITLLGETTADERTGLEFPAGALVEVQSSHAVYLGEVLRRQDSLMVLSVEHTINRAALAEIENMWHKPQGA